MKSTTILTINTIIEPLSRRFTIDVQQIYHTITTDKIYKIHIIVMRIDICTFSTKLVSQCCVLVNFLTPVFVIRATQIL